MLSKAIQIAKRAHEGQKDKGGKEYIFHPLRVMLQFDTEEEQVCAVLHDVIEDSFVTLEDLKKAGIPETILSALDALTKREKEDYENYIERVSKNKLACKIKLADLEDNMYLRDIVSPTEKDYARIEKYKKAKKRILSVCNESNL